MKSPRKIVLAPWAILLAVIVGASSRAGQNSPPPPQPSGQAPKIRVQVNTVIVPVTVKDSGGHTVPGLHKDDFRIFDDDVEQKIDRFSDDPFPLSLLVLIDNDLSSVTAKEIEASLPTVVKGIGDKDEVIVCRFDLNFHPGKGFTADSGELLTQLKATTLASNPSIAAPGGPFSGPSINGQPAPGTPGSISPGVIKKERRIKALDDAMYEAAELLHDRGRPGERRKMILLISDGENIRKYKYSFDEAVRALMQADVAVYGVGVGSVYYNRLRNPLARYAHATGGDIYYAAKRESTEELYSRVTEQARTQYTLWYSPQDTNPAVRYHSLDIHVKRPGLSVLSRDGYYTPGAVPK